MTIDLTRDPAGRPPLRRPSEFPCLQEHSSGVVCAAPDEHPWKCRAYGTERLEWQPSGDAP